MQDRFMETGDVHESKKIVNGEDLCDEGSDLEEQKKKRKKSLEEPGIAEKENLSD